MKKLFAILTLVLPLAACLESEDGGRTAALAAHLAMAVSESLRADNPAEKARIYAAAYCRARAGGEIPVDLLYELLEKRGVDEKIIARVRTLVAAGCGLASRTEDSR